MLMINEMVQQQNKTKPVFIIMLIVAISIELNDGVCMYEMIGRHEKRMRSRKTKKKKKQT